jgi:AcrR family transcriptional regulator
LKLISEGGLESFTLRGVAQRAGVSHPAVYRHYANKEALLAALAVDGFGKLHAALKEAIVAHSDPLDQFHIIGVTYVRFALSRRVHFRLMYGPELARRAAHPGLREASRTAFLLLLRVVNECQRAGRIRRGDSIELALSAWSLVHGLSLLILDRQVDDSGFTGARAEHLVQTATQVLRGGLELVTREKKRSAKR